MGAHDTVIRPAPNAVLRERLADYEPTHIY